MSPTLSTARNIAIFPIRTGREWLFTRPRPKGKCYARCKAQGADLVVKASGVGVFDAFLEEAVLDLANHGAGRLLGRRRAGDPGPGPEGPKRSVPGLDPRYD